MKLSRFMTRLRPSIQTITLLISAALSAALLGYKIFTLNPGLAVHERALPTVKASLSTLWNMPSEAPIHISRLIVAAASPSTGIALSRLPSMLLGFISMFVIYFVIKKWYGYRLALFSTVLFITAPWFLHVSRLATNDVVYPLAMATIILLAALWQQKEYSQKLMYGSAAAVAVMLYVPGALWLILVVAFFERRNIWARLEARKGAFAGALALGLLLLVPLIHALTVNYHQYKTLLALPQNWPSPLQFAQNFILSWQYLFVGGFNNPTYNLGRLAIVNTIVGLSFVVGLYLYAQRPKATRTKQLAGLWIIGSALVALKGPVSYSLVLPIVYVLAIGGIGYILNLWLQTFPRNPYARSFGIGLLALVVLFAVAYNIRNYFYAWPNTEIVKSTFTRQL